jgi:hypothetical protein
MKHVRSFRSIAFIFLLLAALCVRGQTNQFGYQGSLDNSGLPANGNYDFEFVLFDALNAGSQVGATLQRNNDLREEAVREPLR